MAKKEYFEYAQGSVNGQILMNEQVFTIIAYKAVKEIEGIVIDNHKAVACTIDDNQVSITITVNVKYGYKVSKLIEAAQAKVSQAIVDQLQIEVKDININVDNIEF